MEFKDKIEAFQLFFLPRINRIRLEFKGFYEIVTIDAFPVLIESDWNLKMISSPGSLIVPFRINRIRLEFKDMTDEEKLTAVMVLRESDWNLKFILNPPCVELANTY